MPFDARLYNTKPTHATAKYTSEIIGKPAHETAVVNYTAEQLIYTQICTDKKPGTRESG